MGAGVGAGGNPFARLLANLVVMGSGVLGRAFLESYQAALKGARTVLPVHLTVLLSSTWHITHLRSQCHRRPRRSSSGCEGREVKKRHAGERGAHDP